MDALDLYVIFKDRTAERIMSLLNELIPQRQAATKDFEVSHDGKEQLLKKDKAVMKYAEMHSSAEVVVYYDTDHDSITSGFVCYTADGYAMIGLTVPGEYGEQIFRNLVTASSPLLGFMEWECPPPFSIGEFRNLLDKSAFLKFTGDNFVEPVLHS